MELILRQKNMTAASIKYLKLTPVVTYNLKPHFVFHVICFLRKLEHISKRNRKKSAFVQDATLPYQSPAEELCLTQNKNTQLLGP